MPSTTFDEEPESTRARLTLDDLRKAREQAASEPQFTYNASTTSERARDRANSARIEALRAQQAALISEAKAHQWEHKQSIGATNYQRRIAEAHGAGVAVVGAMQGLDAFLPQSRTFTRDEVLTALKTYKATWNIRANTERSRAVEDVLSDLAGIFERME